MHFDAPLPSTAVLADALTFHAFEIDGIEKKDIVSPSEGLTMSVDDVFDVKVTPNRGHDCLCHRGIAKEVAAILEVSMKADQLKIKPTLTPSTDTVQVVISEPSLCGRYVAGHKRGVKVGPSPEWL